MKNMLLLFFALSSYIFCRAQSVSPDSAKYHEGELTTVCGKVYGTHISKTQTVFINFGAPFPNNTFTAVIMNDTTKKNNFQPAEYYENKNICVTGRIKIYKDKPEIVIKSVSQIREPGKE